MTNTLSAHQVTIRDTLGVLLRRKMVIIACVALVLLTTLVASLLQTPRYQASTDLLIRQRTGSALLNPDSNQSVQASRPLMENELGLARSQQVREAASEALGFVPEVIISGEVTNDIMTITASSTDPVEAAEIANAYAQAFIDVRRNAQVAEYVASAGTIQSQVDAINSQIGELRAERDFALASVPEGPYRESQLSEINRDFDSRIAALEVERSRLSQLISNIDLSADLVPGGGATVISEAEVPRRPYEPTIARNVVLAIIVGGLLGVGAALIIENLDNSLRSAEQLKESSGLETLAVVPELEGWKSGDLPHIVSREQPNSPSAEAYRGLRTSVQFLAIDSPIRTVQLTSPRPGDGKTTTAANLAVAVARAGQWVVLVDCDLRKPRVHDYFDLSNDRGFTTVLLGEATLEEVGQRIPGEPNLVVITSGPVPPDPSELLSGKRARSLLASLAERSDLLIVDSPPVLAVSDPLVLSSVADGVIVVASAGNSDRNQVTRAVEQLKLVDAPLLGAVLNRFTGAGAGGYGYGYGATYGTYGGPPQGPAADSTAQPARSESIVELDEHDVESRVTSEPDFLRQ